MKEYNFSAIESKWQKYWDELKTFEASNDFSKKKFYVIQRLFPKSS